MMLENPNITIASFSAVASLITALVVHVFTDRRKIRVVASEEEVKARAAYVELLQKRVGELEVRIDDAGRAQREAEVRFWDRERAAEERCREELRSLESRWRHLSTSLVQWALILKVKLEEKGVEVPKFSGLQKFEEEGGKVPEQWRIGGLE